jgi:uncharacterized protein (TIGR03437 family)
MTRLLNTTIIGILALIFPVAALPNVTGTQTLTTGGKTTLSLDTGVAGTSGGDILWTGSSISMQGNATELNLTAAGGYTGASSLSALDQFLLTQFGSYSSSPLPLSALAANNVFAVITNNGNYAAVAVTAQTGNSITLQFVTFAGTAPTVPKIAAVLNNYGLIPPGFINSGIAPGTLFIIQGYGLASASAVSSLESTTGGAVLPTTLNGASVSVTVGGVTVVPAFYYAENIQLALVLPSGTPIGQGTVTVTYNGQTSAPFSFNVVASAPGFAAYYGTGSGLAHAQDLNYGYFNYGNSIPPNTTIRLIGSGLGADPNPTRDTQYVTPSAVDAIDALAHVYVGGIDAAIVYQGPEGFPGLDEIDITVPAGTPTGCFISVVGVTASGVPTNFLTLPIGTGECQDSLGYTGSAITSLIGNATVNFGSVSIVYNPPPASSPSGTQPSTGVSAEFLSESGTSFGTSGALVSVGSCIVGESPSSNTATASSSTPLNAGTITVNDPNGVAAVTLASGGPGLYGIQLPTGFLTQAGGAFSITATAGAPAPAVGAFNTSVTFPTPLLNWTNQATGATIVRSQGVTLNWSGGEPGTYVFISGSSSSGLAASYFVCFAPVAAGTFTVPPYVLAALPASTSGALEIANETPSKTFTAAGLDYAYAIGEVTYSNAATYQ